VTSSVFVRYEVLRTFRNWRFFVLALAWPLALYLSVATANRHQTFDGISFPLYFMTAMLAMGTMNCVVSSGARIATERSAGWTRQLRITPLSARSYIRAKAICGYLMALLTIGVMFAAGTALGVRLSAAEWLTVLGLSLAGLVPFAVMGIAFGHLLRPDALLPAVGGATTLFALLGGAYGFQIATSGPLYQFSKALPSWWLVQAGKVALHGGTWPAEGWLVVGAWTAGLLPVAVLAYRRATGRS
jgi:ABC-2 type transport system permease protein